MVLLQRLAGVRPAQRPPAIAASSSRLEMAGPTHSGEGAVDGVILEAPRGTGGFGYDPLFFLPELNCTMAELDLETKLSLSHRGRALQALVGSVGGIGNPFRFIIQLPCHPTSPGLSSLSSRSPASLTGRRMRERFILW